MPNYVIAIPAVALALSILSIPIAVRVFQRWEESEEDAEEYQGATEEWSPIEEVMRTARLGETGELDLTWFQLHIRMVEIEERIVEEAKAKIDVVIDYLLEDDNWYVYNVEDNNTQPAKAVTANIGPTRELLVIPGRM